MNIEKIRNKKKKIDAKGMKIEEIPGNTL